MFLYYILPIVAAVTSAVGIVHEVNWLAFLIPGLLSLFLALKSFLALLRERRGLGTFIAYFGCFCFFHLQVINPSNWSDSVHELRLYSEGALLWGVVLANLTPLCLLIFMKFWAWLLENSRLFKKLQELSFDLASYQRRFLLFYLVLFVFVCAIYWLAGGLIMPSVNLILYNRAALTDSELAFDVGAFEGQFKSFFYIHQLVFTLFGLTALLWRSRYSRVVKILAPLVLLWCLGLALSGTRSNVVILGTATLIFLVGNTKQGSYKLLLLTIGLLLLGFVTQVLTVFRSTGLKFADSEIFWQEASRIQGAETLADQTRSFEMYLEGYVSPWRTGNIVADSLLGFLHKPAEFIYFWIPRSLWGSKPEDATLIDFTRYTRKLLLNESEFVDLNSNSTTGLLGRELLRWGPAGPFVTLFWFALLIWWADWAFRHSGGRRDLLVCAAAVGGTCFAMYRELTPLWSFHLMPVGYLVLIAAALQRSRPRQRLRVDLQEGLLPEQRGM